MKKGLIAGAILLGCVLLLSGIAAAVTFESVDVTIDATLEWTIFNETGLMPEATKEDPALALPELTIAVGAWEAGTEDAYIKYMAEMGTISLKNAIGYDIYDLGAGIGEAQGILLGTERVSFGIDAVCTADSEYGIGGTYDAGAFSVGAKYNSTGAYGVQLVYPIAPVTLTGQYGNDRADRTGYLAKAEYALAAGSVAVAYQKSLGDRTIVEAVDDVAEWVDHVWIDTPGSDAVMGDPLTRITATLADFPITDATALKLEVVNQDLMDIDYAEGTTYVVETATTLAENVTFTINVKSAGETLSYFGKIGVSF